MQRTAANVTVQSAVRYLTTSGSESAHTLVEKRYSWTSTSSTSVLFDLWTAELTDWLFLSPTETFKNEQPAELHAQSFPCPTSDTKRRVPTILWPPTKMASWERREGELLTLTALNQEDLWAHRASHPVQHLYNYHSTSESTSLLQQGCYELLMVSTGRKPKLTGCAVVMFVWHPFISLMFETIIVDKG